MTAILQQLGIDKMTIVERIALAQEILDSVVAEQPRPPLSDVKRHELDRRLADHEANPADVVPWEEVETAALKRFGQLGGVQTVANRRSEFGDLSGGATSGEPGDRYLNSHGTRVRDLAEEEHQFIEKASQASDSD